MGFNSAFKGLMFGNSSTQICKAFKWSASRERLRRAIQDDRNLHYSTDVRTWSVALSIPLIYSQCTCIPYNSQKKQQQFPEQHRPTVICNCLLRGTNSNFKYTLHETCASESTVGITNEFHNFRSCRIRNTLKSRPESKIIPESNRAALPANI